MVVLWWCGCFSDIRTTLMLSHITLGNTSLTWPELILHSCLYDVGKSISPLMDSQNLCSEGRRMIVREGALSLGKTILCWENKFLVFLMF